MTATGRWMVAVVVLMLGMAAVFVLQVRDSGPEPSSRSAPPSVDRAALAQARADAGLPPCPAGAGQPVPKLAGVTVSCAADGDPVHAAQALALGKPVVLNLWAYWCGPCAVELPALAQYQRRSGSAVAVVTVHQAPNEAAGLARLADLGVALPTLQDGDRRIAAALGVPNVMPATVVLRADGSVAQVLPRDFANADEIAAAVGDALA